jgi:DNA-directed RNA polymerase sigma subunit (sigma70/sigma32)
MKEIARNQEIYRLRVEEHMTLAAIGIKYNLTRERIRQIVNQMKTYV